MPRTRIQEFFRAVCILVLSFVMIRPAFGADGGDETRLKVFGCVDITTAADASKAILFSKTASDVSITGGLGFGVQVLVPLSPRVSLGGEIGYILTSIEQKSSVTYNGSITNASHYVGFSPAIGLLQFNFGNAYLQGGVGVSVYRSYIRYEHTGSALQSITSTDTQTGGCAMAGVGVMIPLLGFFGIDFSVKYYSTFITIDGKTKNDAFLMPSVGAVFRF